MYFKQSEFNFISLCALNNVVFPNRAGDLPSMSLIAVLPNFPSSPCNFRPVKVAAIFQNLMWPSPLVVSCPSISVEKDTRNTS